MYIESWCRIPRHIKLSQIWGTSSCPLGWSWLNGWVVGVGWTIGTWGGDWELGHGNGSCGGDRLRSVTWGEERGVRYLLLHPNSVNLRERYLRWLGYLLARHWWGGCDWGKGAARGEIETRLGWILLMQDYSIEATRLVGMHQVFDRMRPRRVCKDLESIVLPWLQCTAQLKLSSSGIQKEWALEVLGVVQNSKMSQQFLLINDPDTWLSLNFNSGYHCKDSQRHSRFQSMGNFDYDLNVSRVIW